MDGLNANETLFDMIVCILEPILNIFSTNMNVMLGYEWVEICTAGTQPWDVFL
jgi:hypothetical protein